MSHRKRAEAGSPIRGAGHALHHSKGVPPPRQSRSIGQSYSRREQAGPGARSAQTGYELHAFIHRNRRPLHGGECTGRIRCSLFERRPDCCAGPHRGHTRTTSCRCLSFPGRTVAHRLPAVSGGSSRAGIRTAGHRREELSKQPAARQPHPWVIHSWAGKQDDDGHAVAGALDQRRQERWVGQEVRRRKPDLARCTFDERLKQRSSQCPRPTRRTRRAPR